MIGRKHIKVGALLKIVRPLSYGSSISPINLGRIDGISRRDRASMVLLSEPPLLGMHVLVLEKLSVFTGNFETPLDPMRKRTVLVLLGEKRVWVEPEVLAPID
ncbi:MAG: hypothetical protein WC761_01700 [Candidatus Paceibacterota bacterium]